MYKIEGTRKNGHTIYKEYIDKNIALFEYELTLLVAKQISLSENGVKLKEYALQVEDENKISYKLIGETAFNEIDMEFENKNVAYNTFEIEKERCNWLTLYEITEDDMLLKETYVNENIA